MADESIPILEKTQVFKESEVLAELALAKEKK